MLRYSAIPLIRQRFVADFNRLPVRVRARRVCRWVKARIRGLRPRRPVWRVLQLPRRPVLKLPRLVMAVPAVLPRPGPARQPAQPCGP
jgi:hypothetical protein